MQLDPKVMTLVEWDSNQQQPFFLSRFKDALPSCLAAVSSHPMSPLPPGHNAARPQGDDASRVGLQPAAALPPAPLHPWSTMHCTHANPPSMFPPHFHAIMQLDPKAIMQLDPKVVALVEWDSNQQQPFFLHRFKDALLFFHNIFASHDALASRFSFGRRGFEEFVLAWEMAIMQLDPKVVSLVEWDSNQQQPFFLHRFKDALLFFHNIFASHDALASRFSFGRRGFEEFVLAREMVNLVACEGMQRLVRAESLEQMHVRMGRLGVVARPFSKRSMWGLRELIAPYPKGFGVERHPQGGVRLLWNGQSILGASAWTPGRLVRAESLDQMHARMGRLGVAARPFSKRSMWGLRELIAPYPKGFGVERHPAGGVRLLWSGKSILGASAWTPGVGEGRR
ncbi:unnamed protein product [Closterium sp. Yama58-4]|nr:unnamed protein product [Closterium sp. Yama58-4]